MKSAVHIQQLIELTRQALNQVEKLKALDTHALTWKQDETSWSILECLEHLNLYGAYYLPEIENKIKSSNSKSEAEFKSGLLGGYFAKSMLPKEKLNKMKTFKDKNPLNTNLDKRVIDVFIEQQIKLLDLLNQSQQVSLNKVKIQITISKFIKLKLGDTFHFLVNHIIRHLQQIERIQKELKLSEQN
jgi:hypothetical protein